MSISTTLAQEISIECEPDPTKQIDRVAVEIKIGLIGEIPQKVGDKGMVSITLTPNVNIKDLMFSINTTSATQVEIPTGFKVVDTIKPFIENLKAGDHFIKKITNLQTNEPDSFIITFKFVESGYGYIMAGLRSPSEGKDVIFAETAVFYFKVTRENAYFSHYSRMDLNIQALKDSLTEIGLSKEMIEKEIEKLRRSGAKVKKIIIPPNPKKSRKNNNNDHTSNNNENTLNSVTVQGTVQFTDIIGNTHPVRFATVQIWDEETGDDELVSTTTTDNNGNYSATFDDNDGDGTGRDIYVVVRAEGSTVQVEDYGTNNNVATGNVWEIDSGDPDDDVIDGSTLTIDITANNIDDNNVAFEAYESINFISRYLTDLGEPLPAMVIVRFPRPLTNGASYNPANSWIRLPLTSVHDWDVIHHEYGHHIQHIYGTANNPGGPHFLDHNLCNDKGREPGIRMAWAEGWPTFFGTMVQAEMNLAALNIPNVGDMMYTDLIPGGNIIYSLETFNAWSMGEGNEISVQRVLWDLYDNANDAGDVGVSLTAQELWDVVTENQPHTFSEFWNYLTLNRTEAEKITFGTIYAQHNIAAELTGPANGTVYAGGNLPTFQWDGNLECASAGNSYFSVRFYNNAITALIWSSPWQSTENLTPSNAQRNNIFIGPDGTIQWIVASKDVTVPQTGVYYGNSRTINDNYDVPDRNPVDIILALDISGSMGLEVPGSETDLKKIELLKQAIEIFVRTWSIHAIDGDHLGIVYFGTNISTLADVPPFLKDVITNTETIINDILSKSDGGCTAIGGALQFAYDNFDDTSDNKRVIILFSDGEQTRNPCLSEEGSPSKLKIKTLSGDTPPPFGGYWCISTENANAPDGSPITPDGQFLHEYNIEIHTIGVGAVGSGFEELIQRIANETDALYHFTSSPDEDLDIFFTNDLINGLKTGTLEVVKINKGRIEKDNSKSISIPVNNLAKSLTLVLSWKGELKKDALSMDVKAPNGSEVNPSKVKRGDFYTILNYDFPVTMNEDTLDHWGNWLIRIISNTEVNSILYQFSAIVDEPCFDYTVGFPWKIYSTGDNIILSATLTQNGNPLPSSDAVWVDITSPGQPIGKLLADCLPKLSPSEIRKYKRDPCNELYPRQFDMMLNALLDDSKTASLLKTKRLSRLSLYDDGSKDHGDIKAGDGIYSNILTGTQTPGTYEFRYQLIGQSLCGKITRTSSISAFVGINEFSAVHSLVKAFAISDNLFNIIIQPSDRFGNFLGPGHAHIIQILSTTGTFIGNINDRFNGAYDLLIQVEPGQNPMIIIQGKGKQIHSLTLSDLVYRGKTDTFPTPKIDRISPISGKPGDSLELTILGNEFNKWANIIFLQGGIDVKDVFVVSDSVIKVKICINKDAVPSRRDLIVTNPNGKGSMAKGVFTVMQLVRPIGFSSHIGITLPHGDFNTTYNPGFSIAMDFEYGLTSVLFAEALVGYHNFSGDEIGSTYWINISGNLKYYLPLSKYWFFVNTGPGIYFSKNSNNSFGFNAGGGIYFPFKPNFALNASYNYHSVFTDEKNSIFSTSWIGLLIGL